MKKLRLCTLCALTAGFTATAQSQNGTMVNGEYMLEDFEAREVGESPAGLTSLAPNVTPSDRWQDIHTTEWGIANHKDSKMAWALNAYDHRLNKDASAEGPWSNDFAALFVTVQLPEGKTLADCSELKVDFYNYEQGKTSNANWHKIWLNKDQDLTSLTGKAFEVCEIMKVNYEDDQNIDNGDLRTITLNLDNVDRNTAGWSNPTNFKTVKFDPAAYSGKFNIGYMSQKDRNGFYIDNIRVVPKNDFPTIVNSVRTEANQHVYGTRGGVRIVANGDAEIYTLDGVRVKAFHIEGNELINIPAGPYIVRINGKACKVLVI